MIRVVIIGGGFGGLNAAKALANQDRIQVTLLDRRNHHLFQPLLYQVAMAGLSPAEIATPIRSIFRKQKNVRVLLAEVKEIKLKENKVKSDIGEFEYDYLIVACGAEHSYFGHNDWEDFAPGLKTIEQATEIRRRVLTAFERAEAQQNNQKDRSWLTFVIIGGGPTGVELAGALGEITRRTLVKDFRNIDPTATRIILIEAGDRILSAFKPELSQKAQRDLESLGVQVWTGCRVTEVNDQGVKMNQEWLSAKTVIWAAGVKPSALNTQLETPLDKTGRVEVQSDLSLHNHKNIFVIGDQANAKDQHNQPLPGLAAVAMQQGTFAAQQIKNDQIDQPRQAFRYYDKGQMATIGRKRAVAQIGSIQLSGPIAWWAWLVIHIYYLIGFKNRLFVIWQWAYSYFTYRLGARLITERDWHLH